MKTALITGVLGGMGRATAKLLLENGYNVVGLDAKPKEQVGDLHINYYQVDLTNIEDVKNAYESVKKSINDIEVIVHFAGIYLMDSLVEMDESDFVRIFNINVFSIYRVNKIFLPLLKKGSKIIITSSELAPLDPLPFTGIYAVTKSTIEKYAYSLKMELQLLDISVSVIRPGAVKTGLLNQSLASMEKLHNKTVLYKENTDKYIKIVNSVEAKNIPPKKIAKKVEKVLKAKRPKFVYSINRNILLRLLSALPKRFQLYVIKKLLQSK